MVEICLSFKSEGELSAEASGECGRLMGEEKSRCLESFYSYVSIIRKDKALVGRAVSSLPETIEISRLVRHDFFEESPKCELLLDDFFGKYCIRYQYDPGSLLE